VGIAMKKEKQKTKRRPPAAGMGRPKGALNKFTLLKDEFLAAYGEMGGRSALVKWGKKHPTEFYKIIAHLLPKSVEVSGPDGESMKIEIVKESALKKAISECLIKQEAKKEDPSES
jgi:hypothetical protein